jgi:diaminohydroxyphosphoribosylaminopyrimidine deaminase / 5-amino-6-(5-phosphoribosylamino)uracil reductase
VSRTDRDESVTAAELAALNRAFELARHGPVGENPQVGAVLLAPSGEVLAEGWHAGAGTPHAEAAALTVAAGARRAVLGATAVVTLEPCNHIGRTPSCAKALIDAGVRRVVYSVSDPNPVAAGGAERLRAAGIEVVGGVAESTGRELLADWLAAFTRPYVIVKIAQTLDAKVAAADGTSRWITGDQARVHAHQVRAEVDAIIVGTGTVLADDPSLTARLPDGSLAEQQPERIVLGSRETPPGAAVRRVNEMPGGGFIQLSTPDLGQALDVLAGRGHRRVLVEGGPTLASAFLRAGLVDELHLYLAPLLLGGGTTAVTDLGIATLAQAQHWQIAATQRLGEDLLVIAKPNKEMPCSPE